MVPHTPTTRASYSELAQHAATLLQGVDAVIWVVGGGYIHLTHADLPAILAFLDGRTNTLSLPGGLLPDEAVNA